MKSKDALKRLVACVTSLAITSTLLPSLATHAEMSVVEAEKFPYTLFASSSTDGAISIDTNNVCINGSIATNGTINSTAQNFNVNGSYYENSEYYVPNMVSTLTEKYFSGDNVETYSEDYIFEDININVDIPMDVDGTLEFIGNVNISSNIIAFDDIIFNGEVENSNDSLICSETGNIIIDTSNVNLNGLIYAPEGCVNITAQNLNLNNIIIIADTITINCPSFNANYSDNFGDIIGEEIEKIRKDLNADFDSDGLTDAYETYILIKLKLKGINVNGLSDIGPEDDFDSDGLSNLDEYNYGTDPTCADTDDDGLSDYEEIFTWNTNPNYWDTDGDFMSDGTEVSCGLDPLNVDTDENGIKDGDEVIEQEVRLSSLYKISEEAHLIPMIVVKGAGDFSRKIDVEDVSYNEAFFDINSLVGHPLDFTHEDISFENSTLSFKLDNFILSEHSIDNLAIVWYNYETNEIEFLDTTVVDGSTISAQVDHYSTYGVVDLSLFFDDICWNNDIELTKKGRADIVFAIDTTSSMSNAITKVKQYVNKFASGLENKDVNYRFGLVEYRDIYEDGVNTTVNHGWYNDADSFKKAISNLSVYGGGDSPESAVDALYASRNMKYRPSVNKYIILVTDATYKNGIQSDSKYTMDDEIEQLSKNNFCVSVVSYGYSQYNKLINTTHGISADLDSDFSISLNGLISKIGEESQGGYWIRLSNGSVVKLDKNPNEGDKKFDTDKDGIPDLSELKKKIIKRVYNPITKKVEDVETWTFKSNPSKPDSDGDGLNDNSDVNPTEFDIRLVKNTPQYLSFNTGNIWFKVEGTAQDIFSKQCNGTKIDDSSFYNDLNTIYDWNAKKEFSLYELCCIGLLDNEGSKFYLENESTSTRDKIFKTLCSRDTHYYAHSGIGNDVDDWEQVNSYNDGHWYGKVLSESDINFSLKPFYKIDLLDCIPAIITLGIIVIVAVVVIYATPVIVANIAALCEACTAFGIKQGLALYMTFGAEGVISFIEADMADGDSSIDDILEIGVKSSDNCVSLYRAVSEVEYNDFIAKNNRFDYFPNAMESKWFAVNKSDCYVWADKFYNNECFKVIQINIPEIYLQVDELDIIYNPFLDAIGPAYCIHIEKINEILSEILGG